MKKLGSYEPEEDAQAGMESVMGSVRFELTVSPIPKGES